MPDSKLFPCRAPSLRFSVGHTDERTAEFKQCLRESSTTESCPPRKLNEWGEEWFSLNVMFLEGCKPWLEGIGNLCRLGRTSSILDECEISVVQKCLPGWILQNLFPLESTTFRHGWSSRMAPVKIALPPGVLEVYWSHPITEWFIILVAMRPWKWYTTLAFLQTSYKWTWDDPCPSLV